MGYQFLITPVLLDLVAIFTIAMMFNFIFHWRRYPAYLNRHDALSPQTKLSAQERAQVPAAISHEDFVQALKQIDSFVGVNEDAIKRIFELANYNAVHSHLTAQDIQLGGVYSNGSVSKDWSMRQIIDESPSGDPQKDFVIFKQIAGQQKNWSDCITRTEFAQWAKYPMVKEDSHWKRQDIQSI
jgi:hypothetical protein